MASDSKCIALGCNKSEPTLGLIEWIGVMLVGKEYRLRETCSTKACEDPGIYWLKGMCMTFKVLHGGHISHIVYCWDAS